MKQLTEKVCGMRQNAQGHDTYVCTQRFELEYSDQGPREHYLGYRHRVYQIGAVDVGRHIEVYTDRGGWTCWVFVLSPQ